MAKLTAKYKLNEEQLKQLKQIVPEAFKDNELDFNTLYEVLSDSIDDDEADIEQFGFSWPGKRDAKRAAAIPPLGTLVPVPGDGIDEETTRNIYIEGDNLEVLKIIKKAYTGRIKMIYIDPPYNTGNDLIYLDDFSESVESYQRRTGQIDENNMKTTTNSKADGRFHSKWCSMIYPRLRLARELLREDGVIFISIDDNEVTQLQKICDEIFGEENFVCQFVWKSKLGKVGTTSTISATHEYIICYGKNASILSFKMIERENDGRRENLRQWGQADRREDRPSMWYPIIIDGIEVLPIKEDGAEGRWRVGKEMAEELLENGSLELVQKGNKYEIYRSFNAGISVIPYDTMLLDDIGTTV
jgi:adenine-specific DNA-methyltransferase